MVLNENYSRKKSLIIQAITSLLFLGMCIWACFTSFYRKGELLVPAISAILMIVFFVVLGTTMGVFVGSYTLGKRKIFSLIIPSIISCIITILMYIGEAILLNGNLYLFGKGFIFEPLGKIVLAPVDIFVIILSGVITLIICILLNKQQNMQTKEEGLNNNEQQ